MEASEKKMQESKEEKKLDPLEGPENKK